MIKNSPVFAYVKRLAQQYIRECFDQLAPSSNESCPNYIIVLLVRVLPVFGNSSASKLPAEPFRLYQINNQVLCTERERERNRERFYDVSGEEEVVATSR